MIGRKRAAVVILALLVALIGASIWFLYASFQHQADNIALIAAIQKKDVVAVKTLLNRGADPNSTETSGPPPSVWQVFRDFLDRLRGKGTQPKQEGPSALVLAVRSGETQVVHALVKRGASDTISPGSEIVPPSDRAYKDAEFLRQRELILGCPDDYFSGKRLLVRYEFAACVDQALRELKISMLVLPETFPTPGPPGIAEPNWINAEEFRALNRLYRAFRLEFGKLGNNLAASDQFMADMDQRAQEFEKLQRARGSEPEKD